MTKAFPTSNPETSVRAAVPDSSFGPRHSSVIGASSLVIRLLTLAIRVYQLAISPAQAYLFGPAGGCRFTPTCSQYAMVAFQEHGMLAGGALVAKRICRCHPWGGCGHDPVPGKAERERRKAATGVVLENAH